MATWNKKTQYALYGMLFVALGANMSWQSMQTHSAHFAAKDPEATTVTVTTKGSDEKSTTAKDVFVSRNGKVESYDISFTEKDNKIEAKLQATSGDCTELCDKTFTLEGMSLGENNKSAILAVLEAISREESRKEVADNEEEETESTTAEIDDEEKEPNNCKARREYSRLTCNANHLTRLSKKLGSSREDKRRLRDFYRNFLEEPLQDLLAGGDDDREDGLELIADLQADLNQINSNEIKVSLSENLRKSFEVDALNFSQTYHKAEQHLGMSQRLMEEATKAPDMITMQRLVRHAEMERSRAIEHQSQAQQQLLGLQRRFSQSHRLIDDSLKLGLNSDFTRSDLDGFYTQPFYFPTNDLISTLSVDPTYGLGQSLVDDVFREDLLGQIEQRPPSIFTTRIQAGQLRLHGDGLITDFNTTRPAVGTQDVFKGLGISLPAPSGSVSRATPPNTNSTLGSRTSLGSRIRGQ